MADRETVKPVSGKDASKFYMFKNDKRRHLFISVDTVLKIINAVVGGFFWLTIIAFALGLGLMLITFLITFTSVGFTSSDNPGYQMITFAADILPYVLIVYAVVYITRFVIGWIFIFKESKELADGDAEETKKYIKVSRAIKKIRVLGFLTMIIVFSAVTAIAILFAGDTDALEAWHLILVGVPAAALLINKLYSTSRLLRIQPEIHLIIAERTAKKNEKRPAKKNNLDKPQ